MVRQKLSKALKGKCKSEEHRKRLSESLKGKNKDKRRSDEAKRKLSESMRGENNPFYRKISESKKGTPSWNKGLKLGSNGTHWRNKC